MSLVLCVHVGLKQHQDPLGHRVCQQVCLVTKVDEPPSTCPVLGMRLLCRNNFGNNRMEKELRMIPE